MKRKNHVLLVWGLCNILAPLPLAVLSVLCCWIIYFGFGSRYILTGNVPDWLSIVGLAPIFVIFSIHVVSSIAAIVVSIKKQRETFAFLCFLLSDFAIVVDAVLVIIVLFIGSTF